MSLLWDIVDELWSLFADAMSRGRPWWVWALWALAPIILLGLAFGAIALMLR